MTGEGKKEKRFLSLQEHGKATILTRYLNAQKKDRERSASRTVEIAAAFGYLGVNFVLLFLVRSPLLS
jgi:hypothetical protein